MKKKIKKILSIVLPIAFGVGIIWWSLNKLSDSDIQDIKTAFWNANYYWIALAVLIGLLSHFSRAYRWKYALEPLGYKPRFLNSVFAIFIAYLVNLGIPRAGELARATTFSKYEGIPFEKVFGTIVAERVIDAVMLLLFTFGALFYQFAYFQEVLMQKVPKNPVKIGVILLLIGFLSLLFLHFVRKSERKLFKKIRSFILGLWEGLKTLWTMEKRWAYLFHTFFIWAMYFSMFYVVALAIPETAHVELGGLVSGFVAGAFGTTANGGLGTFPEAVKLVFQMYEVLPNQAYAFGWLMWTAQTFMILFLGLVSFVAMPLYNKKFLK